jgi:hypothetical protein
MTAPAFQVFHLRSCPSLISFQPSPPLLQLKCHSIIWIWYIIQWCLLMFLHGAKIFQLCLNVSFKLEIYFVIHF